MRTPLTLTVIFLAACGDATPPADAPPPAPIGPPASAAPVAEAAHASDACDPAVVALAKPALDCKFNDGQFDPACPAYKAWRDNRELLGDGKATDTVLSMLGDPDLRIRMLATETYVPKEQLTDKARAKKVFELASKETDRRVAQHLAKLVVDVNAEELGLTDDLRALSKAPNQAFRAQLANFMLVRRQTPLTIELTKALIDDASRDVQENAVEALSWHGMTPGVPPVCELLTQTIARTDDVSALALDAGGSSTCPGMPEMVVVELAKRIQDPTTLSVRVGSSYGRALNQACKTGVPPKVQKQAFALARKLTDPRVKENVVRYSAVNGLVSCDPVAAKPLLTALMKDKDKLVAFQAKNALSDAERAIKQAKEKK